MSAPDDDVQRYLGSLSVKLKRELVEELRAQAEGLRAAIADAAPKGETGNLADSVRVRRGRHSLELVVEAGGDLTTKEVRQGSGVAYDYALGTEFGNEHVPAQPFFYSTAAEKRPAIEQAIADKVEEILERA